MFHGVGKHEILFRRQLFSERFSNSGAVDCVVQNRTCLPQKFRSVKVRRIGVSEFPSALQRLLILRIGKFQVCNDMRCGGSVKARRIILHEFHGVLFRVPEEFPVEIPPQFREIHRVPIIESNASDSAFFQITVTVGGLRDECRLISSSDIFAYQRSLSAPAEPALQGLLHFFHAALFQFMCKERTVAEGGRHDDRDIARRFDAFGSGVGARIGKRQENTVGILFPECVGDRIYPGQKTSRILSRLFIQFFAFRAPAPECGIAVSEIEKLLVGIQLNPFSRPFD